MANTLRALTARGHRVTVLTPHDGLEAGGDLPTSPLAGCRLELVSVVRPPKLWHVLTALATGRPWTIQRHRPAALSRRALRRLQSEDFDLVHAEQVQGWGAFQTLGRVDVPAVWRAQNVESDLWRQQAETARGPLASYLNLEAGRLARYEGRAVAQADATLALTEPDAQRLGELAAGAGRLHVLPAPFLDRLPDADQALPGDPALVVLGSRGWRPNQDGARWFVEAVWPRVRQRLPKAHLHLFGGLDGERRHETRPDGVTLWTSPRDSRQAFAPGSVLLVPLHVASGIRMKILESWARGVPVVATSVAVRGLHAVDGVELFVADEAEDFARALEQLQDADRRRRMVQAGRRYLQDHHALESVAKTLEWVYGEAKRHSRRMFSSGPTSSSTSST